MEKILKKLEDKFETQMKSFEDSPIKTSLKWLVIIYILRKVWGWIKEEEKS